MRIIDADALIDRILTNICKPCKEERKEDYNGVRCRACQYGDEIDDIEDAPTIEPERKKERWEWVSSTYDRIPCEKRYICSSCHHATITHDSDPWEKYCPNCGARMEE